MGRILRIFLTGVLALLPVAVTFFVVAWVGSFVAGFAGRGSFIGGLITGLGNSLGLTIEPTSGAAYLLGLAIIVGAIFLLGLLPLVRGAGLEPATPPAGAVRSPFTLAPHVLK